MNKRGVEWIFVGYSKNSKSYRIYNKETKAVIETVKVRFDDQNNAIDTSEEDVHTDVFEHPMVHNDTNRKSEEQIVKQMKPSK